MYKFITGVQEGANYNDTKEAALKSRQAFVDAVTHFKNKRGEYLQLKAQNNLEREILRKEERMAKSFKFTKMSKRVAFLPSLHTKGFLEENMTCLDKGTEYVPQREKDKLMFPDRVNDHANQFKLSDSTIGYF